MQEGLHEARLCRCLLRLRALNRYNAKRPPRTPSPLAPGRACRLKEPLEPLFFPPHLSMGLQYGSSLTYLEFKVLRPVGSFFILAGTPTARLQGGTSLVTTEPAATNAPSPTSI